jgi:hypothetical protein
VIPTSWLRACSGCRTWLRLGSGCAQDRFRYAQALLRLRSGCSPSAEVKAAAAHVRRLKRNQWKKNSVLSLWVSRQYEFNRRILAFSISHDEVAVSIYPIYSIIDRDKTSIYRRALKRLTSRTRNGKYKWTPHKFTRNPNHIYGPIHFERLRSAIVQLPDPLSDQHQSQQSDVRDLSQPDEEESTNSVALASSHVS